MVDTAQGNPRAAAIHQTNLDPVSKALWEEDLDLALEHRAIPNQTVTQDAEFVVTSSAELNIILTDFLSRLRAMGADSSQQVCRRADFATSQEDVIVGMHDTVLLNDGKLVRPPYLNEMTLVRSVDGRWRGCRIKAATQNTSALIISPDMAVGQQRDLQRQFRPVPGTTLSRTKE